MSKENKQETMKFDPPIKSRFLPGEVEPIFDKGDFKGYKEHRMLCANMKPKVDNKPPKFNIDTYYDREKLKDIARAAKSNYKENLTLSKRINAVFRLGGKTDCWNFKDRKYNTDQKIEISQNKRIVKYNKILYQELNNKTGEYSPQVMAKQWKLLKEAIEEKQRFPWFKEISKYPSITHNAIPPKEKKTICRPTYFFDLELAASNLPLGRIVFELYTDYVPLICANFEAFCKGYNGGTPFHRIVSGYWCQGGDVTKFNGVGGTSIYEDNIPDENFTLQHTCPGVLSTYSDEKNVCDSKFNLTFGPLRTMDGRKIVFGKVVKGLSNLFKLDAYGTKYGKPLQKIIVSNCGLVCYRTIHCKEQNTQNGTTKSKSK